MMKHKTAELEGRALDAAVVLALGLKGNLRDGRAGCYLILFETGPSESRDGDTFEPSTRWDHGGPLIDKECIALDGRNRNGKPAGEWCAKLAGPRLHFGRTPLIAAMRAFVGAKLGDEVELP